MRNFQLRENRHGDSLNNRVHRLKIGKQRKGFIGFRDQYQSNIKNRCKRSHPNWFIDNGSKIDFSKSYLKINDFSDKNTK